MEPFGLVLLVVVTLALILSGMKLTAQERGGADATGTQTLSFVKKRTVSLNLASVATIVHAEQDLAVAGLEADEVVIAFYPAEALGVAAGVCYARTKGAGEITVGVVNPTAGALDAGAKNFTLVTAKIA